MSSSRRTGGEIHILAMLDGKTTGSLSRRLLGLPRACWYAAAAVIVCVLLAALAWLVRMPATTPAPYSDDAGTQAATPTPTPIPTPSLRDAPASRAGAAIIDTPVDAPSAPAPTAPAKPPASIFAAAPVLAPPPASAPSRPHSATTAAPPSAPAETTASRIRAHDTAIKRPTSHATVRTTNSEHKPAPLHAATARTDAPARAKRQTGAAKPTPSATLDTDVALISAIIQHTSTHPDPADTAPDTPPACTRPGCHTRLPNRQ